MGGSAVARQGQRKGDFLAGKYLLEDCLGIGGMGEVYRATNVSLGRKVAIKLLSSEYVNIEEDVLRFLREARAAAGIRHGNVVDVLDVARDDDGTPFIVQELLAGEDLERYLKTRGGRLSPEEALEIMIPVADAVAAAHAQNVVHRDLKPANIFLARDRNKITPKVLDFGACLFPTIAERSAKEIRMLIGTPHYMAPEQIMSKADVGARSDVWALGVILYEMLVGETPFEAETANAVLQLVKTREVPRLREHVKDAPPDLEELIARCTKRDRLERWPDAGALHENMLAVRRKMRGEPNSSRIETIGEMPAQVAPPSSSKLPAKKLAPATPPRVLPKIPSLDQPRGPAPKPPPPVPNKPAAKPAAPAEMVASAPQPFTQARPERERAGLLTLSSPESEPPVSTTSSSLSSSSSSSDSFDLDLPLPPLDDVFGPASSQRRPIEEERLPSKPSKATPNRGFDVESFPKASAGEIYDPMMAGRSMFDPSGVRDIGHPDDERDMTGPLALAARPSSWPPPAPTSDRDRDRGEGRHSRSGSSSIPPVLDPRAASNRATPATTTSQGPSGRARDDAPPSSSDPASGGGTSTSKQPGGPPVSRRPDFSSSRSMRMQEQSWSLNETMRFVVAVAAPALFGFVAILIVPALGTPLGGALRGDSPFASGALAVIALVAAAALCARAFLGERDRWMYAAAAGGTLFGIVMIIVTFSASEAAELGIPSSMSGLTTLIAPIAPLSLALRALGKAREAWVDPYAKTEKVRFAALASLMLFLTLAFSPMGAVRTPAHPPQALKGILGS